MRAAIIGYGKMGHVIEQILLSRGHEVVLKIDLNNGSDLCAAKLHNVDVAIEFTTPATAFDNVRRCLECGVAVVSGTTGWGDKLDEARKLCKERGGAFFYSSNYSVGVNIMFAVSRRLAELVNSVGGYSVSMTETHHVHKKDAPSGTAITLAEGIAAEMDGINGWTLAPESASDKIQITALREGEVAGIHTVRYESDADSITLTHDAKNRSGFALGAVLAAEFTAGKQGCFSMNDMLKL